MFSLITRAFRSRSMAVAAGLNSFVGYAIVNFMPSFIVRSFDMQVASLGLWLGLIYGIAGGFGFFMGGYLADHFGREGHGKALRFVGLAILVTALLSPAVFLATSPFWCLVLFILPAATSNAYLAPVLSQTQGLVSLRMRSVASAIVLLIING